MKKVILGGAVLILAIIGLVTLLKSCGSKPQYAIYNVYYDYETKTITWDDNSDAKSWTVTINGESEDVKTKSYKYDAGTSSFTLSISAKGTKKDVQSFSATFNYLAPVSGLRVENGCLVWDAVPGANRYTVYDASGQYSICTTYDCYYEIMPGSFNLYVLPECDGYYFSSGKYETKSGVILEAPYGLRYENGVFSWNAVNGADYYEITINGEKYVSTTNSYPYSGNKTDMNVSVAAGSNSAGSYLSAPLADTCYYLAPVTEFSFDETGALVWPAVAHATGYTVHIDGRSDQHVTTPYFTDIALDTRYTVTVTPYTNLGYTDQPVPYSFEKLSPVTNIAFANGTITWDNHMRAEYYEVIVNGNKFTSYANSYTMSNIPTENLTIQVYAARNEENSRSFMATTASYTYIPKVENLRVEDGILTWNASEGASGYQISFSNGTSTVVNATTYADIQPNRQYVVKVRPTADIENYYTYDSQELTFTVLAAPTVTFQQGVFRWNGSGDAQGYAFRVVDPNGQVITENLPQEQFTKSYSFNIPGRYTISVKLIAKPGNNVYDSQYSAPIYVTQLADVTGHQIINNIDSTAQVQIMANAVNGASGYKVSVNGTDITNSNSNTFALDLLALSTDNTEVTFRVAIKAIGNTTSNEVFLDSKNDYVFNLVRLATPQNVTVSGNRVTWNNVSNANKYILYIDGARYECTTTEYTFTNLSEGNHKIKVQAINSDSQVYMPSRYSNEVSVTKLPKPANVRLEKAGDDIVLRWDAVNSATGYQLQIGIASSESVNRTSFVLTTHSSQLQGGDGKQITVYAKGDGATVLDSEPSDTITIAKLNAPQNLTVSGDNITWSAAEVDGVMASSYILYIDGVEYPVTGTSYSTANIPEGTHTVCVVAVGSISNNRYSINSDKSGTIYVEKLAQVSNINKTGNTYTWDPVFGAEYAVTVDGVVSYTTQPSIEVNFDSAGTHTVSIQAYSRGINTIASNPYVIEQQVIALRAPAFVNDAASLTDYSFTYERNGDDLTIIAKAPSDIVAVEYEFYIEGIVYKNSVGTHTYHITDSYEGCEYTIKVKFITNGFGTDGNYYISSQTSQDVIFKYSKIN